MHKHSHRLSLVLGILFLRKEWEVRKISSMNMKQLVLYQSNTLATTYGRIGWCRRLNRWLWWRECRIRSLERCEKEMRILLNSLAMKPFMTISYIIAALTFFRYLSICREIIRVFSTMDDEDSSDRTNIMDDISSMPMKRRECRLMPRHRRWDDDRSIVQYIRRVDA